LTVRVSQDVPNRSWVKGPEEREPDGHLKKDSDLVIQGETRDYFFLTKRPPKIRLKGKRVDHSATEKKGKTLPGDTGQ